MIYFYWMNTPQSRHRTVVAAYKKALIYLKANGHEYLKFVSFIDTGEDTEYRQNQLYKKFQEWVKDNDQD